MKTRSLSDQERVAWLRLIRTERIGPTTFQQLMDRFGWNAQKVLDALPELTRSRKAPSPPPQSMIEDEIAAAQKIGVRVIALCEPDYPEALADILDAPPLISVRGDMTAFLKPGIAMVGARNASAAGRRMARDIARDLSAAGYVVTSGMARGIDGEAHMACLRARGSTIGVLAGGVDAIYPPEHASLYQEIIEHGLIVSEQPLGYTAKARDFPKRNRIIGGLCLGVLVVEAARRSGSLISSRMALEQGRVVMAVPGSPLDDRTAGSNGLLKQDAWLIENAEDVINALEGMATPRNHQVNRIAKSGLATAVSAQSATDNRQRLLQALSPTPIRLEDLAAASGLTMPVIRATLAELELDGEAESQSGGTASLPVTN